MAITKKRGIACGRNSAPVSGVTSVNGETGDVVLDKSDIGLGNVDNTSDADKPISDDTQDALDLKIDLAEKSAPNGVATLDGAGKVPIAQIPNSIVGGIKVIGFWNANTNSPNLSALTLNQGEAYQVSVAGSTTLNGESNWRAKDLVVWSDTLVGNYFKLDNTDDVLSVNGLTGAVTLTTANIADSLDKRYVTDAYLAKLATVLLAADIGVTVQGYDINTTKLNVAQQFTKQHNFDTYTLSVASSKIAWDLDIAQRAYVAISANTLLRVPTNIKKGFYAICVDVSSSAQLTYEGAYAAPFKFNTLNYPVLQNGRNYLFFESVDGVSLEFLGIQQGYAAIDYIVASGPHSWYNTNDSSSYTGTVSNITGINDFGSDNFDGTKAGTNNILLTINAINTISGYTHDGTNWFDLGAIPDFASSGSGTIIAVVKPTSSINSDETIHSFETTFDTEQFFVNPSTGNTSGLLFDGTFSQIQGVSAAILAGQPAVLSWTKRPGGQNSKIHSNNIEIASGNQPESPDGAATNCRIGAFSSGAPLIGNWSEIIKYRRVVEDVEREPIVAQLMAKNGLI